MYLVPFTDHPYYLWQALVQAIELRRQQEPVTYLAYYQNRPSRELLALGEEFPLMTFRDWRTRAQHGYNPAMKPWLVSRYLRITQTTAGPVTVIDPDSIPLLPSAAFPRPKPGELLGTSTDSYTGKAYLARSGAWVPLCRLLGLDPGVSKGTRGIGAQYRFLPSLGAEFWELVADRSVAAFKLLAREHPAAQPWCAEMFTTQILALREGVRPRSAQSMGMLWSSDPLPPLSKLGRIGFLHNAGVLRAGLGHFSKLDFQVSPFGLGEGLRRGVAPSSASNLYVDLILEAEERAPELVRRVSPPVR